MKMENRAILSLCYKLVDNYSNLTLFGGVVRDIIAPGFFKGKYPFDKSFKTVETISDVDVLYECDGKEDEKVLYRFVYHTLQYKIREWDWKYTEVKELNIYGMTGLRIHISHQIFEAETHIDFVKNIHSRIDDTNVNQLRFNKKKGVFIQQYKRLCDRIGEHFRYQQRLLAMEERLDQKLCRMICDTNVSGVRRFVKMIRKGWTIENISSYIVSTNKQEICMICHEKETESKIELTCSKCVLCLDCFQTLLEKEMADRTNFRCPTCRTCIQPWNIIN